MKKIGICLVLLLAASSAEAAVTVNTTPTSLVNVATTVSASSAKAIFEFAATADAAESLSSVSVTLNSAAAVSADLASISVYKDDGDGSFDSGDALAGTNTTVNVGSATIISTASNNTLTGAKFFVVLNTAATWTGTDTATVTFDANGIVASANSPVTAAATTAALNATAPDTTGPVLQSAVAKNTGTTAVKEAGDSVELTFNEATDKPTINAANIATVLVLNNSHSWLDGATALGATNWNTEGTVLTVVLTAGTSVPTVEVGDTVTIAGSVIKDAAGNNATGSQAITGSFVSTTAGGDDEEEFGKACIGGVINGRLYKIGTESTVYLVASCKLKPFRGAAVFHARGHKFQNIITLSALPTGVIVSDKPALPAGGTLVQGSDATVWFVSKSGKRKGFVSENSFKRLGFSFKSVKKISDSDLATMAVDSAVTETSQHPDGAIIKCGNSATIFEVKNSLRFPFTNPSAFLDRGHSWDVVSVVDCGRFAYLQGNNIE